MFFVMLVSRSRFLMTSGSESGRSRLPNQASGLRNVVQPTFQIYWDSVDLGVILHVFEWRWGHVG